MRALILAAGRGSRLGALTSAQPKCMTSFFDRSLLQWQIDALRKAGIDEIAVVRGYNAHLIQEPVRFFENRRWAETNMVGSLLAAHEWLAASDTVISYSDIVYPASTVQSLAAASDDLAITYNTNWFSLWQMRFEDPLSDAETFRIDAKGNLIEIGRRAKSIEEIEGQYMGLLKFTRHGWSLVNQALLEFKPEEVDRLDMTSLLNHLLKRGLKIKAVPVSGDWLEVDTEKDLRLYESMGLPAFLSLD